MIQTVIGLTLLVVHAPCLSSIEPVPGLDDDLFVQEFHEPYTMGDRPGARDVRAVAVDRQGGVWAATRAGVYWLKKGERQWSAVTETLSPSRDDPAGVQDNPTFDVIVDTAGRVWIGSWNGLYQSGPSGLEAVPGIHAPVAALCAVEHGVVAAGPDGLWRLGDGHCATEPLPGSRSVRRLVSDPAGGLWIASGMGLNHLTRGAAVVYQKPEEILSSDVRAVALGPDGRVWAGGLGGVTLFKEGKRVGDFTPRNGLPSAVVQSVCQGPDGVMWVGTDKGIARYDGKSWSIRHGRRWLVNDEVRGVVFDGDGTAWVATAGGVSAIRRVRMTLAAKADRFLESCHARHIREPGLVEKCRLKVPGELSSWEPRDDDNDGQYTAMYLAMESLRYAVTHDPDARAHARKAFEALRFLQTVTDTPGFVSRSVIPVSWTAMSDPNEVISDPQAADRRVKEPREKRVAVHWHPSRDGKWRWKGDTSSDEITGHFFGYLFYYDLAADDEQRERVRTHLRRVMDYIIDGGYVLKDLDGTHTRWGVWSPQKLNHDPDWVAERGINSVEILSFLQVAGHITGDAKYRDEMLRLLREHGYAANVRHPKTYAPAWRTHIDDELLALAYPGLLAYEKDPQLTALFREGLEYWYQGIEHEASPFFGFVFASLAGHTRGRPNLEASVAFLRDAPLDLIRWRVDNQEREDLHLCRAPELESLQVDRLLPPSERGVVRWDDNPWIAVQGDGGETESDGVYWLLPYWMGRYYGYVHAPLSR